jgi:sulfur-carrier protein adenylyltransferase/sulfurtransferase
MRHVTAPQLLGKRVRVLVAGAGGTGSQIITGLARLDRALRALGHPGGLDVHVMDPDRVSDANVGRQLFYASDVGQYKCDVLIHRLNMAFGTAWSATPAAVTDRIDNKFDLLIGCVDSAAARRQLARAARGATYWLDCGNRAADGQVILGEPLTKNAWEKDWYMRLPVVTELFPALLEEAREEGDDQPSCSLAEALARQELFVNQAVATHALQMLWQLFRYGGLDYCGVFVNLATQQVRTIAVDREVWKRFGHRGARKPPTRRASARAQTAQP